MHICIYYVIEKIIRDMIGANVHTDPLLEYV
jgi:hypothetical protein